MSEKFSRIRDIAREAGVGTTTVDRVLNDRGSVSAATASKVIEAAVRLGTKRLLPDAHRPLVRLALILPTPQSPFRHKLAQAFRELKATLDRNLVLQVDFADPFDVGRIAEMIRSSRASAIAFCSLPDPAIDQAVAEAKARGGFVATIVGDLPESGRDAFFGIDNYSAARTGMFLVASRTAKSGTALVFTTVVDHASLSLRIKGFEDGLRDYLPGVALREVFTTEDKPNIARHLCELAFRKYPDLALIYNCGAANGAIGEVLRARDPEGRVQFIGHELTPNSRELMQQNRMFLAIDQNAHMIAKRAVDVMATACGFIRDDIHQIDADRKTFVPFMLHTRENLRDDAP